MLIVDHEELNQFICLIKDYVKNVIHFSTEGLNIFFTNNIVSDANALSPQNTEDNNRVFIPNGTFLIPTKTLPVPTILISETLKKENEVSCASTLLHEITHYMDCLYFCLYYCENKWDNVYDHELYAALHWWSEFHARINSIIHTRILFSCVDNEYQYDETVIANEMLKFQLPMYNDEIESKVRSGEYAFYDLVTYCARYHVCQYYNQSTLKNYDGFSQLLIDYDNNILKLYEILSKVNMMNISKEDNCLLELQNFIAAYYS